MQKLLHSLPDRQAIGQKVSQASVELAEAAGVPDERIVRTTGDVDEFMG